MALGGDRPRVFVGFSTPRTWNPLSALIRAMTRSRASHAWLLVEDPIFKLRLVLEAHSSGFRLVSFLRFVKENRVVALLQPRVSVEGGLPAAGSWLGERFDVLGLFGIFLVLVQRWFKQGPLENPFPTSRALFCSEAVIRTLQAASYPGAADLDSEATSPAQLLTWLVADGCAVVQRDDLKLWRHLRAVQRGVPSPTPTGAPGASVVAGGGAAPDGSIAVP
jgi:hypothetical protein